ncbi:hypothetical protein LSAT2_012419, partial [Lamellibrachia satsuma]
MTPYNCAGSLVRSHGVTGSAYFVGSECINEERNLPDKHTIDEIAHAQPYRKRKLQHPGTSTFIFPTMEMWKSVLFGVSASLRGRGQRSRPYKMSSPGSSGRRRVATRQYSAEDQALDQIAEEVEARLASKRAARAEAREIRMRELERQQQEVEEKQDRRYGMMNEQKRELSQLEERYKKAMMSNAQLDNEKQTYQFQVDLLKDQMDNMEEQLLEVQSKHRNHCKLSAGKGTYELEHKKRDYTDLQNECAFLKQQLQQRDELINENGLVYVSNGTMEDGDASSSESKNSGASKGNWAGCTPNARGCGDTRTSQWIIRLNMHVLTSPPKSSTNSHLHWLLWHIVSALRTMDVAFARAVADASEEQLDK